MEKLNLTIYGLKALYVLKKSLGKVSLWALCAPMLMAYSQGANAGVCDVTFGINVEGGLRASSINRIRQVIATGNTLTIKYYWTTAPTEILTTTLNFTGGIAVNGVFDASFPTSGITTAVLNQLQALPISGDIVSSTQRPMLFRAGNGASNTLNFTGPYFRFRPSTTVHEAGPIGLNQVAAGAITGIWADYNFTNGVPSIAVGLYSPNRNPQNRVERIDLVCPTVFAYRLGSGKVTTQSVPRNGRYVTENRLAWIVGVTEDKAPIVKYEVYRSSDRSQLGTLVSGQINVPANRNTEMVFVDSGLNSSTQYFYRLRPILSDNTRPVPTNENDYILSVRTLLTPPQRAAITSILAN